MIAAGQRSAIEKVNSESKSHDWDLRKTTKPLPKTDIFGFSQNKTCK